jgi:hypothetical protein
MWNFIKQLFTKKEEWIPGVLSEGDLGNNIHSFEEGVGISATPRFPLKKISELEKFTYQYQARQSSCVAFTTAKIAQILYYRLTGRKVKFSPGFYYSRRFNKPELGMFFSDIKTLASEGACLYDLLPCEGLTEEQINNLEIEEYHKQSADAFALPKDWIDTIDFDTTAATISKTKKPVMLWFSFGPGEWFGTSKPKILGNDKKYHHSVCATETFTELPSGIQYIKIEDSADTEKYYEKYITREFFNDRCWLHVYPRNFKFTKEKNIPIFTGTVKSMQAILQALGYFPDDKTLLTGFWGSITDNAVSEFCKAYGLAFVAGRKLWPELEKKLYSFN